MYSAYFKVKACKHTALNHKLQTNKNQHFPISATVLNIASVWSKKEQLERCTILRKDIKQKATTTAAAAAVVAPFVRGSKEIQKQLDTNGARWREEGGKKSKYNNIPHIQQGQQQHNGYKLACKRLLPLFSQPFQQQTSLDKEETEDELADATTLLLPLLLLGHPAKGTFVYCTKSERGKRTKRAQENMNGKWKCKLEGGKGVKEYSTAWWHFAALYVQLQQQIMIRSIYHHQQWQQITPKAILAKGHFWVTINGAKKNQNISACFLWQQLSKKKMAKGHRENKRRRRRQ